MKLTINHTPAGIPILADQQNNEVAIVHCHADAQLIARAVNCHDDLLRACQAAIAYLVTPRSKFASNRAAASCLIRDAIAKAERSV